MIIALVGGKGGSGKSTVAINLVAELLDQGATVLAVDGDPQGSLRTWAAVASENGHPTPRLLSGAGDMHKQLVALARAVDHTVIDCPGRLSDVQRSALMVADVALLPVCPSALDAWALTESAELAQKARALRPELRPIAVINRRVARSTLAQSARAAIDGVGIQVLRAEMGARMAYAEAPAAGLGVTTYARKSPAADEMRAVVRELLTLTPRKEAQTHGESQERQQKAQPRHPQATGGAPRRRARG